MTRNLVVPQVGADTCQLCEQPVKLGEQGKLLTMLAHRVCLLRSAMGGIGHLENHTYWCNQMHDPDGGRSYYQSALEVDEWVHARYSNGLLNGQFHEDDTDDEVVLIDIDDD